MFGNLTNTSIFWIFLGLLLTLCGGYIFFNWRIYTAVAGLLFLGTGCVFCGLTNGFTDHSPTGKLLWKGGMIAFLIGLPLTGYYLYRFI